MRREHWIYAGFGIILVVLIVTYVYDDSLWGPCKGWKSSQERGPHGGMHHRGQFFGLGFYGFGLLFWVLVIFFVVIVFFNSTKKEDAIDILNKRYAQGKISREEYTQMKEELRK